MKKEEIQTTIIGYLTEHVFSGKLPSDFTNDTVLISGRLINSIAVLHMISFLEEKFKVQFEAHEVSVDNLDTVKIFTDFLYNKINAR